MSLITGKVPELLLMLRGIGKKENAVDILNKIFALLTYIPGVPNHNISFLPSNLTTLALSRQYDNLVDVRKRQISYILKTYVRNYKKKWNVGVDSIEKDFNINLTRILKDLFSTGALSPTSYNDLEKEIHSPEGIEYFKHHVGKFKLSVSHLLNYLSDKGPMLSWLSEDVAEFEKNHKIPHYKRGENVKLVKDIRISGSEVLHKGVEGTIGEDEKYRKDGKVLFAYLKHGNIHTILVTAASLEKILKESLNYLTEEPVEIEDEDKIINKHILDNKSNNKKILPAIKSRYQYKSIPHQSSWVLTKILILLCGLYPSKMDEISKNKSKSNVFYLNSKNISLNVCRDSAIKSILHNLDDNIPLGVSLYKTIMEILSGGHVSNTTLYDFKLFLKYLDSSTEKENVKLSTNVEIITQLIPFLASSLPQTKDAFNNSIPLFFKNNYRILQTIESDNIKRLATSNNSLNKETDNPNNILDITLANFWKYD